MTKSNEFRRGGVRVRNTGIGITLHESNVCRCKIAVFSDPSVPASSICSCSGIETCTQFRGFPPFAGCRIPLKRKVFREGLVVVGDSVSDSMSVAVAGAVGAITGAMVVGDCVAKSGPLVFGKLVGAGGWKGVCVGVPTKGFESSTFSLSIAEDVMDVEGAFVDSIPVPGESSFPSPTLEEGLLMMLVLSLSRE